jgi:hypothetical protein
MTNFFQIIYKNFIIIILFSIIGLFVGIFISININNKSSYVLNSSLEFSIQDTYANKAYSYLENLVISSPLKIYEVDSFGSSGINISTSKVRSIDYVKFKESEFLYSFVSSLSSRENRDKAIKNVLKDYPSLNFEFVKLNTSIKIQKYSNENYSLEISLVSDSDSFITERIIFELLNIATVEVNKHFINHLNSYINIYINDLQTNALAYESLIAWLEISNFENSLDFISFFKENINSSINIQQFLKLKDVVSTVDSKSLKPVFVNYPTLATDFRMQNDQKPFVVILSYFFIGFFLSFFFIFIRDFFKTNKEKFE